MKVYARNIADALTRVDPENAAEYAANLQSFYEQVQELDRQVREKLAQVSFENRGLLAMHNGYAYLSKAYSLPIWTPDHTFEKETSAADIARLQSRIESGDIAGVLVDHATDPRHYEALMLEDEQRTKFLHADTLTKRGGEADSYFSLMHHNIDAIVDLLAASQGQ